jgi:hypothetical protein
MIACPFFYLVPKPLLGNAYYQITTNLIKKTTLIPVIDYAPSDKIASPAHQSKWLLFQRNFSLKDHAQIHF